MSNPYLQCPTVKSRSFTFRLIDESDADSLFQCYNDPAAVALMNDDNCDFGFYVESRGQMLEAIRYWLDFYRQRCFIRFAIVDNSTGNAIGTVEGFGGKTGVLRADIAAAYEKVDYLAEILDFARSSFRTLFGNEYIVIKAAPDATERRLALNGGGWEYIGDFRGYQHYYRIGTAA